jgi:hypothetical protein
VTLDELVALLKDLSAAGHGGLPVARGDEELGMAMIQEPPAVGPFLSVSGDEGISLADGTWLTISEGDTVVVIDGP